MMAIAFKLSVIFSTFFGTIIVTSSISQGNCSVFKVQPNNKTVKYGEIVQLECQVHMEHNQHFYLYFGNTIVYPSIQGNFSTLDQREFSVDVSYCSNCLQNQTVAGRIWILINRKTLQIINSEPFRCRVFHNRTFEDSSLAFIKVIYPECTVSTLLYLSNWLLATSTFVPPKEVLTNSASETVHVSIQELNLLCSAGPSKKNTPGNMKSNNLPILSVCAGLALVMLTLLTITYVCICFQHRKRLLYAKSSKLSRNQPCENMVDNPIYESDGPVYDSVKPLFSSLTSQVTAATKDCAELKLHCLESSASLQQLTDKKCFFSQPSLSQSGSFSFIVHPSDHPTTSGQLALQDGQECSHCTTDMHNSMMEDTYKCGEMLQPRRISCSSLSDGTDEQDPKEIRKDNINS